MDVRSLDPLQQIGGIGWSIDYQGHRQASGKLGVVAQGPLLGSPASQGAGQHERTLGQRAFRFARWQRKRCSSAAS